MPGPKLTTQEAEVTTASVEIRTLTVRGKQVTMGMFRQLIRARLIDYDVGSFEGVPWGTVNYHPECTPTEYYDSAAGREHLHVVWQLDSDLRHAVVYRPRAYTPAPNPLALDWLTSALAAGWRPVAPKGSVADSIYVKCSECSQVEAIGPLSRDHRMVMYPEAWHGPKNIEAAHANLETVSRLLPATDDIWEDIHAQHAEDLEANRRLHARWEELKALPQLFIAV